MGGTRRSGAKAASNCKSAPKSAKRTKISSGATEKLEAFSTAQSVSHNTYLPSAGTMLSIFDSALDGLDITHAPSAGRKSEKPIPTSLASSLHEKIRPPTGQVKVALQKLVIPGSSHNPIVVDEGLTQPRGQQTTRADHNIPSGRSRISRSKLNHSSSMRRALAIKPLNGNVIQRNRNIHHTHATGETSSGWNTNVSQYVQLNATFEERYPISAEYIAPQHNMAYPSLQPDVQYWAPTPIMYSQHMAPPPPNEEQLRTKALHYVQEYSRLSCRKRKITEAFDKTSESKSRGINHDTNLLPPEQDLALQSTNNSNTRANPSETLPSHISGMIPLIEHALLLASLLKTYPYSADQAGMREDIAMLASVQNQCLADWLNSKVPESRKQAHSNALYANSNKDDISTARIALLHTTKMNVQGMRDEKVRGLLSSDSEIWQDGSGMSVADVYTETRAFTPSATDIEDVSGKAMIVDASLPVQDTVKISSSSPPAKAVATVLSPIKKAGMRKTPNLLSKADATKLSPVASNAQLSETRDSSPGLAKTASSPAVRKSGRKRMAPARFRAG